MNDDEMIDPMSIPELTKKEKEDLNKLRGPFYVVKENSNHIVVASRRVEISRVWSRRMLVSSFFLNCFTVVCFLMSMWFVASKPEPKYYGTTPNGKIYELKSVQNIELLL
jgi:hypothetical protein